MGPASSDRSNDAIIFAALAAMVVGFCGLSLNLLEPAAAIPAATLLVFVAAAAMAGWLGWRLADGTRNWWRAALAGLATAMISVALVALVLGSGAPFLVPLGLVTIGPVFAVPAVAGALACRLALVRVRRSRNR